MFSALVFAAVAVMLAQTGGFLLAGAITSQQDGEMSPPPVSASPTPGTASSAPTEPETTSAAATPAAATVRTDIAPGASLKVVEVSPGVMRVVSDGVRSLGRVPEQDIELDDLRNTLVTGLDGSVWLVAPEGLIRLGSQAALPFPDEDFQYLRRVAVAADGSPWLAQGRRLYRHDGQKWRKQLDARVQRYEELGKTIGFQLLPDGSVWVELHTDLPGTVRFRRSDATGGWAKVPSPPRPAAKPDGAMGPWIVLDDGTAWGMRFDEVIHFDGERWEVVGTAPRHPVGFAVTPGGSARLLYDDATLVDVGLGGRLPGSDVPSLPERLVWFDTFDFEYDIDDVRIPSHSPDYAAWSSGTSSLAPDGSLWRTFTSRGCRWGTLGWGCGESYITACDGVAALRHGEWVHLLPDRCVGGIEFAPDGSAWLWASETTPGPVLTPGEDADPAHAGAEMPTLELGPLELYVITPEAATASE